MNYAHWNEVHSAALMHSDGRGRNSTGDFRPVHRCSRRIVHMFVVVGLSLIAFCGMAGCSSSTAKTESQTPLISVNMSQTPPASMTVSSSVQLTAAVNNDVANAGVNWVAVCTGPVGCGTFTPSHTPSGGTTTFTAPAAVPSNKTVAVTAVSATDQSKFFTVNVTIMSTVTGVTITQAAPATAPAYATITVAATVAGDPAGLGVDWKASCGGVSCGAPPHSPSGVPTTFVVPGPSQVPTIVGSTVTLTAYATADHSFQASTYFTVLAPISVNITQPPPASMYTNQTAVLTATVQNDPTNSGVTWQATCTSVGLGGCGTIVPSQSASGASVTFTAPATVPTPAPPTVTITATSVAAPTVQVMVSVTIVAPVSVTITQGVPANTIVISGNALLAATVSNDPSNAGVDWSVTCGSPGACGSFSPTHTASGATTTYTAPAAVPTGSTVQIIAASTAEPNQTATETVTVSSSVPPNSLLLGNAVILLSAKNSQNGPYVLGGFFTGDGSGNITGGRMDEADAAGNVEHFLPLTASTYSIGAEGTGQIQLQFNAVSFGAGFGVDGNGAITLTVAFVTATHAVLSESDSFGSATGTLDLQNANDLAAFEQGAWTSGNYALELSGTELAAPNPNYYVASALAINLSASSYSYVADLSDNGEITSAPFATVASGLNTFRSGPTLTFNSLNLGLPSTYNLDAWLIDATHFAVVDWDDARVGTPQVLVAGYLTIQPVTPALSGTYAFTEAGATSTAQTQVAGGIFTCGSTGVLDVVPLANTALSDQPINANCSAPANGRGLITISGAATAGVSQFGAYPTSDQGVYLIELDGGPAGTSGPSGAGIAMQQTATTPINSGALNGAYASNFSASTVLGSEVFGGQVASDGVSALTGTADVNSFTANTAPVKGTPSLGTTLGGSYTAASNGRFPLMLTITPATGQPAPEITTLNPICYIVNANSCLLLGSDTTAPGTGVLQSQNTGL